MFLGFNLYDHANLNVKPDPTRPLILIELFTSLKKLLIIFCELSILRLLKIFFNLFA